MTRFNEPWRINPEHPSVIEDCNGTSIVNAEPETAKRIVECVNEFTGSDDPKTTIERFIEFSRTITTQLVDMVRVVKGESDPLYLKVKAALDELPKP